MESALPDKFVDSVTMGYVREINSLSRLKKLNAYHGTIRRAVDEAQVVQRLCLGHRQIVQPDI